MLRTLLTGLIWGLLLAYAAAIALFLLGQFGLLGLERDPLAGVFLIPLGLPWNRMIDSFPQPLWPWLAALAPLANVALLVALRALTRRAPPARR